MLEMAEGRRDDPKRIGTAEHFLVRLESRHGHPVKREKQHKHENAQWNINSDPPTRDGLQIIHALLFKILLRSEEHTSELQSLMRISYAVFCLKKKKHSNYSHRTNN